MANADLYLYRVSQPRIAGYDYYDSMVVCAPDAEAAKAMEPNDGATANDAWPESTKELTVTLLGTALDDAKPGVILASFNAG